MKASLINVFESFILGSFLFFVIYFNLDDFILVYVFILQTIAFRYFIQKETFYKLNLILYFALSTFIITQLMVYCYQYFAYISPRISVNPLNAVFLLILLPIVFYSISMVQMKVLRNNSFTFKFSLGFFNAILILVIAVINLFRSYSIDFQYESTLIMIYSFTLAVIVLLIGLYGLFMINKQHKRFSSIQEEISQLSLDKFEIQRTKHNRNNILFTIHFYLKNKKYNDLKEYVSNLNLEE